MENNTIIATIKQLFDNQYSESDIKNALETLEKKGINTLSINFENPCENECAMIEDVLKGTYDLFNRFNDFSYIKIGASLLLYDDAGEYEEVVVRNCKKNFGKKCWNSNVEVEHTNLLTGYKNVKTVKASDLYEPSPYVLSNDKSPLFFEHTAMTDGYPFLCPERQENCFLIEAELLSDYAKDTEEVVKSVGDSLPLPIITGTNYSTFKHIQECGKILLHLDDDLNKYNSEKLKKYKCRVWAMNARDMEYINANFPACCGIYAMDRVFDDEKGLFIVDVYLSLGEVIGLFENGMRFIPLNNYDSFEASANEFVNKIDWEKNYLPITDELHEDARQGYQVCDYDNDAGTQMISAISFSYKKDGETHCITYAY